MIRMRLEAKVVCGRGPVSWQQGEMLAMHKITSVRQAKRGKASLFSHFVFTYIFAKTENTCLDQKGSG